jgi:hypothetical protein
MIWGTLAIVLISLGLIIADVRPLWIQLVAFAVSLSLFIMALFRELPHPAKMNRWFKKRIFLILSITFLLVINLLARQYESIHDVSESKIYSLRPKTIEWLNKISDPVRIMIFLRSDDKTAHYADWLQKQVDQHTDKISVEVRNINKDVVLAQRYEVKSTGETVLIAGDHWIKVGNFKEDILVQGLIRLLSKSDSMLCFLTGHGEADLEDGRAEGLSELKKALNDLGYQTKTVTLINDSPDELLEQCSLLILISPRTNFLEQEEVVIKELFNSSLPFLLALDPPTPLSIRTVLHEEGIDLSQAMVINKENFKKKFPVTDIVLPLYLSHPILKNIRQKVYLPHVQSLHIQSGSSVQRKIMWDPLIQTPANGPYHLLEDRDGVSSSFDLAIHGTGQEKTPLRVIFGSGKGFQSANLQFGANKTILINSIRWLLQETEIEWVVDLATNEALMEISSTELIIIKGLCFFGFPTIALFICLLLWFRRQKTS